MGDRLENKIFLAFLFDKEAVVAKNKNEEAEADDDEEGYYEDH